MKRMLSGVALLVTAVLPARAQPRPGEPIRLTIRPAAEPVPALKYRLLPELEEQEPGNRALLYYRSLSPEWWTNIRRPGEMEKFNKALSTPLKQLPREGVGWVVNSAMLRQVDRAARREYLDWGITPQVRKEGIGLLLPDVQSFREIATLLALRCRLEAADGHFDKAVYSLQTGMTLGRDVSRAPTLIHFLVGRSIIEMMLAQTEDLIQTPESPNLYWALAGLPRPFVDLRKGLEGEKVMVLGTLSQPLSTLSLPKEVESDRPLTPAQQQELMKTLDHLWLAWSREPGHPWPPRVSLLLQVAKTYPEAKRALLAQGRKPAEVEALPALQVVTLYSLQQFQRLRDDLFKWYGLPYWQAAPHFERAMKEVARARAEMTEGLPIASNFLPGLGRVAFAQARTERRIAALRCIEAIRLYAAAHDGRLPASLGDITEVPVPPDPVTGKGFDYKASGNRATLYGPPPPGEAGIGSALKYELTLQVSRQDGGR
jgi:hypothetical protein